MDNKTLYIKLLQSKDPVLLYDGECLLCHRLIRLVIKFDKQEQIKLAHIQSTSTIDIPLDTISLVDHGQIYHKSVAVMHVLFMLGFPFNKVATIMKILPTNFMDFWYDFVAKNRYRWFGKNTHCLIIDDNIKRRMYRG